LVLVLLLLLLLLLGLLSFALPLLPLPLPLLLLPLLPVPLLAESWLLSLSALLLGSVASQATSQGPMRATSTPAHRAIQGFAYVRPSVPHAKLKLKLGQPHGRGMCFAKGSTIGPFEVESCCFFFGTFFLFGAPACFGFWSCTPPCFGFWS
jgi:hypothetical protein